MDKRGQSLSMDTIIITILVVIVLVIVALFFTGGMSSLTQKVSSFFGAQLTGLQEANARCNAYCISIQTQTSQVLITSIKKNFCTTEFNVDINGNGVYDKDETKVTCASLQIPCDAITC